MLKRILPGLLLVAMGAVGCVGQGEYRLHLVFPDEAIRDSLAELVVWALEPGGNECDQLVSGQVDPNQMSILTQMLLKPPFTSAQQLARVPAGDTLFFAEGRTETGAKILRGCARVTVKGGATVHVTIETARVCTPDPGGEEIGNLVDDDCDGFTDECANDNDCVDTNGCTNDFCSEQECHHTSFPDGLQCNDSNLCTGPDTCLGGVCQGQEKDCSEQDGPCVDGVCDPQTGECGTGAKPDGTGCTTGNYCTAVESCQGGVCAGVTRDCNDGDDCTRDSCDEGTDECINSLEARPGQEGPTGHATCGNSLDDDCDGLTDSADPNCGVCSDAAECDDDNPCTNDTCVAGDCENESLPDGAGCDDGHYCSVGDQCDTGVCMGLQRDCSIMADQCNEGYCAESMDECVAQPLVDSEPCDDGQYCTVADSCRLGECVGAQRSCDDDDPCSEDTCDENGDVCQHAGLTGSDEGPLGDPTCENDVDDDCDGNTDGEDEGCCEQTNDLSTITCEPPTGCAAPPICDDLVLLLHFDRLPEFGESDRYAHDFSGRGNHAQCVDPNCPVWTGDGGRFGGGFDYASPQRFEVPHSTSLSIPDAVTVSAWFFPHTLPSNWRPVVSKVQPSPERSNYWLGHTGDEFHILFHDDADWQGAGTSLNFSPGQWYHLVGVIDNSDDTIQLYVNGSFVINDAIPQDFLEELGSVWIGWAPGDSGVDGIIDEVAVWSRRLTLEQIRSLYPSPNP